MDVSIVKVEYYVTWIDVLEAFDRLKSEDKWPTNLKKVSAYWDGLNLELDRIENRSQVEKDLSALFPMRIIQEKEHVYFILDSTGEKQEGRKLPIFIEQIDDEKNSERRPMSALFSSGMTLQREVNKIPPENFPKEAPALIAMHSFKGGVGRTIHAIALAEAISKKRKQKVLLVDADIEAPGISWMLGERNVSVSYIDLLALIHGDASENYKESLDFLTKKINDDLLFKDIYILPSFRMDYLNYPYHKVQISPEHFFKNTKRPFLLSNMLSELGQRLGVGAVILDLRAGYSEVSAGFLLDPRVYKIFVSTLAPQSIDGTKNIIRLVTESCGAEQIVPSWILSSIPRSMGNIELSIEDTNKIFGEAISLEETMTDEEEQVAESEAGDIDPGRDYLHTQTDYDSNLAILDREWDSVLKAVEKAGIVEAMRGLDGWFHSNKLPTSGVVENLTKKRELLREYAHELEFAEEGSGISPMPTKALENLAADFTGKAPIAVIVGAKGSGKTYTYIQMLRCRRWSDFTSLLKPGLSISSDSYLLPVTHAVNLGEQLSIEIRESRKEIAKVLGLGKPVTTDEIRKAFKNANLNKFDEMQWMLLWLDIIAWGAGFSVSEKGAGKKFIEYLFNHPTGTTLTALFDGLEDEIKTLSDGNTVKAALRSLLILVPEYLAQIPGRPLGICTFIRKDLVEEAIEQNSGQFLKRYERFELHWNPEEALRLVLWICKQANILDDTEDKDAMQKSWDELIEALVPLWGDKMGNEKSKKSRSAQWILGCLVDYTGQVQARDITRFLDIAAQGSLIELKKETQWEDRILVPNAIRVAVTQCGDKKIKEIENENTTLKEIFSKLKGLEQTMKKVPFKIGDLMELTQKEIATLSANGIIKEYKENGYYIAELYRSSLGFSFKKGGRASVIALRPFKN